MSVDVRLNRGPHNRERLWGPIYALPAVVLVVVFIGYPFGSIIYHSFTHWNGLQPAQWIGIKNYRDLLHDSLFRLALRNNLLFAISVPIQVVVPLLLAYLIHERIPGWRLFRATYFLPAVYSTVVIGLLAQVTFAAHGAVNVAFGRVGLTALERDWLGSGPTAIGVILLLLIWANFGYNVVLYLAGMSTIDPQLPEAARVDGAGRFATLRHVYIPSLRRVIELVLVTNTITAFAYMLTYIFVVTNGGPGFDTYDTEFLIYNEAFSYQALGYASAIGVVLTLIILVFGFFQIRMLTGGRTGSA